MAREQLSAEEETSLLYGMELADRMAAWSGFLRTAVEEIDPRHLTEQFDDAVEELDKLWTQQGLMDKECLVSGYGMWGDVVRCSLDSEESDLLDDEDGEGGYSLEVREGRVESVRAISLGFVVLDLFEKGKPELLYYFELESAFLMTHPTLHQLVNRKLYVKADTLSFVPVADFEEPFIAQEESTLESTERVVELTKHSQDLVRLVGSAAFRRSKHHEQKQAVDSLIERAEAISNVRQSSVLLEAQYCYHPTVEGGKINHGVINLQDSLISGTCLGLTMISRPQLERKAIRRDDDLINKHDGLCLSVEIDGASELPSPFLNPGSVIHIPISSQRIDIVLEAEDQIAQMMQSEDEET